MPAVPRLPLRSIRTLGRRNPIKLLPILVLLALPAAAGAQQVTDCYGWEDDGTILGSFNTEYLYVANTDERAYAGERSLEIRETGGTTTPQAWVAWLPSLAEGDVVTVSLQTWDPTPTSSPSVRLWGNWTQPGGAITTYAGSAIVTGVEPGYSGGTDWVELTWTWTVAAADAGKGLLVQVRPYGSPPFTDSNWLDNICVTRPAGRQVQFPGGEEPPPPPPSAATLDLKVPARVFLPATGEALPIHFSAPAASGHQTVLRIFDTEGRLVVLLFDSEFESGPAEGQYKIVNWDGRDAQYERVRAGMYVVHLMSVNLQTGDRETKTAPAVVGTRLGD